MAEGDILVDDDGVYVIDVEVGTFDLDPLPKLNNKYFALRHGQSTANLEGVISSNPEVGTVQHGLTALGRVQARAAATAVIEAIGRNRLGSMVYVSSDFTHTLQTAEQCCAAMKNILAFKHEGMLEKSLNLSKPIVIRQEIKERAFGELDATPQANFSKEEYKDACVVFASHADILQIMQCYVAGVDERLFSQYRFKNGEVRSLLQDPSSLPPPHPLSIQ